MVALLLGITGVKAQVEWTIWEGSMNASSTGTAGSWDNSLQLKSNNFANLSVGDVIYFTLTKNSNASGKAHVELDYQNELVIGEDTSWPETKLTSFDTDENCSYTITSDNLKYFQGYYGGECTSVEFINLRIKGADFTLTKVSIKKYFSAIKTTLSNTAVEFGSWANGYEVNASELPNVQAGDFFYVPAEKDDKAAELDWQAQFYYDWNALYHVSSVDHDIWAEIQQADVSNITNNTFRLKGKNYNCYGVYLYHPIPSFSIGSIGMATFSADQQVTAPNTVIAYKATINEGSVSLTPFTNNVIPANTGAIIKGDEDAVLEFVASSESTSEESALLACTSATDVSTLDSDYDYYVLYPSLSLSTLLGSFGGWNSKITWDSSTYTAKYTEQTGNSEGGWVGADWSAYDKLKLNFSANTLDADVTFSVTYTDHDEAKTQATLAQGSTSSIEIKLNSDYKSKVRNFEMVSNATSGSITFKSAALIDKDGAPVAEFRKTTSGTLAANKAYLKIAKNNARALRVVFEDDITGINNVEVKKPVTINDDVIYNLNGQVVTNPSKGIYIKNGKKFIVK